jgi:WhiB family redox-sensing transcriptional regulator
MPSSYGVVNQPYLEPEGAASLDWQDRAACAGADTDRFFPWGGNTPAALVALCGSCPVAEACREYALDRPWITGVWGGTTATQREQIRIERRARQVTHCHRGHEFTAENTYTRPNGHRVCRACDRYRKTHRIRRHQFPRETHCIRGHEWTEENTFYHPTGGHRQCRICKRERDNRYARNARAA